MAEHHGVALGELVEVVDCEASLLILLHESRVLLHVLVQRRVELVPTLARYVPLSLMLSIHQAWKVIRLVT